MKRLFSLTALMLCIVMMLSMIPVGVSAAEFTGDDRIVIVLDPGHGTQGVSDETNKNEGAYNMRTILPYEYGSDGFFFCRMRRK